MSEKSVLNFDGVKHFKECFDTELGKKVSKVDGKNLSTNDYTTEEKDKLAGIASGANKYTHPTSAGNKHIPSGGSSGQILRWSANGTAVWGDDTDTKYSEFVKSGTDAKAGLVPAPPMTAGTTKYLREDGVWSEPDSSSSGGHGVEIKETEPTGQNVNDEWLQEY